MQVQAAIHQWKRNPFTQDSQIASQWFCNQVDGFHVARVIRCTPEGEMSRFSVATNGQVQIRLIEEDVEPVRGHDLDA